MLKYVTIVGAIINCVKTNAPMLLSLDFSDLIKNSSHSGEQQC